MSDVVQLIAVLRDCVICSAIDAVVFLYRSQHDFCCPKRISVDHACSIVQMYLWF